MTLLIVDDHMLFVEALKSMLEGSGIHVIGTARDGLQAVERVRELHPDLVLMDISMPRCDGFEATRRIKAEFPDVKVVMLTMSADDHDLFEAIRSGAAGYITKDTAPEVFIELLNGIHRGEAAVTHKVATRILGEFARTARGAHEGGAPAPEKKAGPPEPELSPRQIEILRLIAEGLTYKEIAARLAISERTVNYHLAETLNKLRLQNRAQAIAYATRHGLIGPAAGGRALAGT